MLSSLISLARSTGNTFLEVLAPRHCELCNEFIGSEPKIFEFICNKCADSITPAPYPDELFNRLASNFQADDLAITRAAARFQLDDKVPIHRLLYALKYHGKTRIGSELGIELSRTLKFIGFSDYDAIVPVPLHPTKERMRGYNQAEIIANAVGNVLNIPVVISLIRRARFTQSQTTLDANGRRKNVAGAFQEGKECDEAKNKRILLVDDVLTTGSTMNACATLLLELGARRVDASAIASA